MVHDVEWSSQVFGPVSVRPSCWVSLWNSAGDAEQPPPGPWSNSLSHAALSVRRFALATA